MAYGKIEDMKADLSNTVRWMKLYRERRDRWLWGEGANSSFLSNKYKPSYTPNIHGAYPITSFDTYNIESWQFVHIGDKSGPFFSDQHMRYHGLYPARKRKKKFTLVVLQHINRERGCEVYEHHGKGTRL